MALSSCFIRYTLCVSLGIDHRTPGSNLCNNLSERCKLSLENTKTGLFGLAVAVGGIGSCEIAASAFTWGTVAVLPCYALMVVAPRAEFTKKVVGSSIPYIGLGMLYAYLLYLSWTPDTIRIMFASKYLLPELPGIAKMFSSEITLASAWIHFLAVDLFAARQVYFDGLEENVETRHSVSICLLFCPIGILTHFITKALTTSSDKTENGIR